MAKPAFTKNAKMIRVRTEHLEKLKKRAEKNGTSTSEELDKLLKRTLRNE